MENVRYFFNDEVENLYSLVVDVREMDKEACSVEEFLDKLKEFARENNIEINEYETDYFVLDINDVSLADKGEELCSNFEDIFSDEIEEAEIQLEEA